MDAKQKQGMAALEEFLQQKYVDLYDEIKNDDNKVLSLINNSSTSKYFYKPTVGVLQYIIDSEGHALYLIDKSGLPEEIQDGLVGGDARNKEYIDYRSLNDVYGVTTNLKVYYCSNGLDTLYGLNKDELDNDNPLREVFEKNNSMSNVLSGYDENNDGIINADEAKSVKQLTINKDSKITSLNDLYNLVNLKEIIFDGVNLTNLDGLENTNGVYYIYFKNHCVIDNYSKLGSINKTLQYLYFFNTTDDEISKLCDFTTGIANYDFEKLEYFAIVGNEMYICTDSGINMSVIGNKSSNLVSDISSLSNFSDITKKSIKYLSLQCNELTDISCLMKYSEVRLLRLEYNNISSLHGLENMSNLISLYANNNNLGVYENVTGMDEDKDDEDDGKNAETDGLASLKEKNNLVYLRIENNPELKWVDYISEVGGLKSLRLAGCPELNHGAVAKISKVYFGCELPYRSIDKSLESFFQMDDILNYKGLTNSNISELNALKSMSPDEKNKVKKLDLSSSSLDNDKLQEVISYFPNLICLNVNNCTNLSTLNFTNTTKKLEQILFLNTSITGNEVSKLDDNTNVKSYRCNNQGIDLTKMQKTISRATYYTQTYSFDSIGNGIAGDTLIKKLEDCKNVTYMWLLGISGSDSKNRVQLDFGKMTALRSMRIQANYNIDFIFSEHQFSTIEWYCSDYYGGANLTIKDNVYIDKLALYHYLQDKTYLDSVFGENANKNFSIGTVTYGGGNDTQHRVTRDLISLLKDTSIGTVNVGAGEYLSSDYLNFNKWGRNIE